MLKYLVDDIFIPKPNPMQKLFMVIFAHCLIVFRNIQCTTIAELRIKDPVEYLLKYEYITSNLCKFMSL